MSIASEVEYKKWFKHLKLEPTQFPYLWIYVDIVFGQLHLLMLGTELEAVPADTVSFELCIYSYLRASCVHSDRVCRLYSFIINVLLLFECRWSHSLKILLHVRNNWGPVRERPFYAALFVVRLLAHVFVGRGFELSCRSSDI